METLVVSGVLLVSFLLLMRMMEHFSLWWTRQEDRLERAAAGRYVMGRINELLMMSGYRSSIGGIHAMEKNRLSVEYLMEGAEAAAGYSRHRLFTIHQDGSQLKLTTRRRLLPFESLPPWGEGATSVLADEVRDLTFRYLDSHGRETATADEVRMVTVSLRLGSPARTGTVGPEEDCFQTAVALRNHRG